MHFLETRSGSIRAGAIDLIGAEQGPESNRFHLIEYHIGAQARETRASADDVADFFSTLPEVAT
jgi:hypothetical protein